MGAWRQTPHLNAGIWTTSSASPTLSSAKGVGSEDVVGNVGEAGGDGELGDARGPADTGDAGATDSAVEGAEVSRDAEFDGADASNSSAEECCGLHLVPNG